MEGISLFGATPRLKIIPASGIIILASRMASEVPSAGGLPFANEISIPEEIRGQSFAVDEPTVDLVAAQKSMAALRVLLVMVHRMKLHLLVESIWTT